MKLKSLRERSLITGGGEQVNLRENYTTFSAGFFFSFWRGGGGGGAGTFS